MNLRSSHLSLVFTGLVSVLILSACGGGGGSGGSTVASTPVAITSANAETAAGASATNVSSTYEAGSLGAGLVVGAATGRQQSFRLVHFARKQLRWLKQAHFLQPLSTTAVSVTLDIPCDNSGKATVIANDADNSGDMSSGDSFSITLDNCLDNTDQTVTSGSMTMTINAINGNPDTDPVWSLGVTVNMRNLASSGGNSNDAINGDFSLAMNTMDGGVNITGSISGNSLTIAENGVTETLSDYVISFTSNDASLVYTLDSSGTVASTALDGSVQFQTLVTFEGIEPAYPHVGVMKISGANASSVTLTVIDNTTIQLDIDEDGDGLVDETRTVQWQVLDA